MFYVRLSSFHTILNKGYIKVSGVYMGICLYRGGDEFKFIKKGWVLRDIMVYINLFNLSIGFVNNFDFV